MELSASGRNRLRLVTMLVFLGAFVAFAAGQWFSANWLYGGSFDAAEKRDALARARHAQAIVRGQADSLQRSAVDNAVWDDSYNYMLGKDAGYPDRMFSADSYASLRLHVFAFIRMSGEVVEARQYDPARRRLVDPSAVLKEALTGRGAIGAHLRLASDSQGFARVGTGIYAWGSASIKPTDGSGTPVGYLVLITRLDDAFLRTASDTLDSQLAFATHAIGPRERGGAAVPLTYADTQFTISDPSTLQARFSIGALDDASILDLTITTPRVVHAAAARTSQYFLWSTLGFGLLISALALWFIQRRILGPLQAASDSLVDIGRSGDLSRRLRVPGEDDEIARLIGAANDMLGQLESKRDAETVRDFAIAESRLKSEFLARMSHEIRTPMNAVMGMSELLLATDLSARQRRLASTVYRSAESLLDVINDILDFSKIEAGRLELSLQPFDLREAVEEAVELLGERAHSKGLELIAVVDPSTPRSVVGDSTRVRQILTNLIGNAIKFTEQGEVVVRVTAPDPARASVEFSVTDTGIGIPADAQKRIFDSFAQADISVTRRFGGTGLGLAIVKQLVKLMNGDIRVESGAGKGSTFTVTLAFEVREPGGAQAGAAVLLQGLRVLIVDSNATVRKLLANQLSAAGAIVADSDRLESALPTNPAQAAASIDVVLVDRRLMNGANGAWAQRLKSSVSPPPRIVALSWVELAGDRGELEKAGIDASLSKPVRERALLATIAQWSAAGRLARRRSDQPQSRTSTAATAVLEPDAGGLMLRVLVAEDNAVNSEVAKGMLDALGCVTCLAANGRDALEIFDPAAFDVILMDCQMPEMDGFAATEEIRRREARAGVAPTPIFALTANAMSGDRERCLVAGMNDFLTKPYTLEQLRSVLATVVRNSKLRTNRPGEEADLLRHGQE